MKRKLLCPVLIVALALSGCATIKGILGTAQVIFCSWTEQDKVDSVAGEAYLEQALNISLPEAVRAKVVKALTWFDVIQMAGCIGLSQLQEALDVVGQVETIIKGQLVLEGGLKAGRPAPVAPAMASLKAKVKK